MVNEKDEQIFKDFVNNFSIDAIPAKPKFVSRRHQVYTLVKDEIEGECIELALTCLKKCNCPTTLSFAIAREVTNEVIQNELYEKGCVDTESETKTYSPKLLEPIIHEQIVNVCKKWKTNLPNICYEQPPVISECSVINLRRKMEDRHNAFYNLNILHDLSNFSNIQFYGVYDGHAGVQAAIYTSKYLHLNLVRHQHFPNDILLALKQVLKQLDDNFCEKAKKERIICGTTVVVAVIYDNTLYIAWIGDSQAIVVKEGSAIDLTPPHKPGDKSERKRIEDAGGTVLNFGSWRVNGNLSVSRAIGDPSFKPYVCADADVVSLSLDGTEDYLCLACDGFWDVFQPNDVPLMVSDYISKGGQKENLSAHLCKLASDNGSEDNITVIVVFLRNHIKVLQRAEDVEEVTTTDVDESLSAKTEKSLNSNNSSSTSSTCSSSSDQDVIGIKGLKVEPCAKEKPSHRLLLNYIPKEIPETPKKTFVLNQSYPHLRLPSSFEKLQKKNPQNIQLKKRSSSASLLSLTTVKSGPVATTAGHHDVTSSTTTSSVDLSFLDKPLGHRAQQAMLRNGPSKQLYQTSTVRTKDQPAVVVINNSLKGRLKPVKRSGDFVRKNKLLFR